MIPKRWEINEVTPMIALAYFFKRISRSWYREEKRWHRLVDRPPPHPNEEMELRIWENQGGESSQSRVIGVKKYTKNSGDMQRGLLSIQQSTGRTIFV